jgi:hypothetical protein
VSESTDLPPTHLAGRVPVSATPHPQLQLRRALTALPGWRIANRSRALRFEAQTGSTRTRQQLEAQAQRALEAALAARLAFSVRLEGDRLEVVLWHPSAQQVTPACLEAARTILRAGTDSSQERAHEL